MTNDSVEIRQDLIIQLAAIEDHLDRLMEDIANNESLDAPLPQVIALPKLRVERDKLQIQIEALRKRLRIAEA
jgi:hypothetical protein